MRANRQIAVIPEITDPLAQHAPVAFRVSGGKDSSAMALVTNTYLDEIGHAGPRLLIHSDLGRVEWQASLPMCQRLADREGLELLVMRRQAGDLLDRWRVRWQHNVERYCALLCVKLILPWSTASMRFCTSELKTAIICRALVELEIVSTFSFQDHQWLGDLATHLLDANMRARLHDAKRRAALREAAEARIPRHLWYSKGWSTVLPIRSEAVLLAEVRCCVAEIMGLAVDYTEPDAILERYAELMAMNAQRPGNATPSLHPIQEELWSREAAG